MEKINWEQRRYEIAKDAMQMFIPTRNYDNPKEDICAWSIELADELIKQLQNNEENEEK